MNQITVRDKTPIDTIDPGDSKAKQNPTLVVPRELRPAIGRLWACNAHLIPDQLSLFATFRVFLDDHGLAVEDVPLICSRLLAPERRANHMYANQFFADLAGLVAEVVRKRKVERETAQRLAESEGQRKLGAPPEEFVARPLAIGKMPGE